MQLYTSVHWYFCIDWLWNTIDLIGYEVKTVSYWVYINCVAWVLVMFKNNINLKKNFLLLNRILSSVKREWSHLMR